MHQMRSAITGFTTTCVLASCASTTAQTQVAVAQGSSRTDLVEQVEKIFNDSRFENAFWGAAIQSLDSGEVWYERNADKLFMPASNEKIPTAAAGLLYFGPDWTFTTHLCAEGEISGDTLDGNLVVFGNGDPTMYTRFQEDSRSVFFEWADKLKENGITRVTGDLIGDDNAWDENGFGYGWTVGGLDAWYSAETSALSFNENYVDLTFKPPATVDGKLTVTPNIPSAYFEIVDKTKVVAEGRTRVSVDREYGTNQIVLSGTVVAGDKSFERSPSIWNPTGFYVTVLKETLESRGIEIDGDAIDCDEIDGWNHEPGDFTVLDKHASPPLREILAGLMKRSQNMYAENMVRVMGHAAHGEGSFSNGRRVVKDELSSFGVPSGGWSFMDGSGLSRYNYVSPRILLNILKGMRQHEYWEVWKNAQPIAGVDGTLRRRMKGTAAEGNVRAKTGTISNTRGLSGYVTTAAGEEIVFSFLVNAHQVSSRDTEDVTDGVLALIAAYQGK